MEPEGSLLFKTTCHLFLSSARSIKSMTPKLLLEGEGNSLFSVMYELNLYSACSVLVFKGLTQPLHKVYRVMLTEKLHWALLLK